MKMKYLTGILCALVINIVHTAAVAQQQNSTQKHLMREDSAAVNALVMYPDTIRLDIFEACEYPSSIVSIASLQRNSSEEFVNLISSYSKIEQEDFWNLSRYPGLISRLAQEGKKSIDKIMAILSEYPADIHETALAYGTKYYGLLQKMDEIQARTDAQFERILGDYPPVTQEALRELVQFPEIISLLNDHLGLAVRVGDRYRRDPQGEIHRADSLNLAEARQNAEDAEAWKQSIEQNPDEADDLKNAANDYATENGYTQEEVNASPEPEYVSNYTCNPYSYWFGYPTWYPYSYWYPYPFWFDCGFYYDRHGRIVIIGSPSPYFSNWYFYYPEHWHHYPHLCNTYINHYYGRRRSAGRNNRIVHNWVREHRNYLPKDFVANNSKRSELIRQVAQLDMDAQEQKGGKPVTQAVRDQYFENNKSQYPSLNTERKARTDDEQHTIPDGIPQPEKRPPARIPRMVQEPVMNPRQPIARHADDSDAKQEPARQQPVRIPRAVQEPVTNPRQPVAAPAYNFNKINKAQEYQRNIWEQTQPIMRSQPKATPPPQVKQPEPAQRPQPAPAKPKRSKDD
jgi:hypothetical protein